MVSDATELMQLITFGNNRRFVANTGWNNFSSRSHAILIFNIEGVKQTPQGMLSVRSKLQMIDLAGSERAASSENRGQRMLEGALINKSLLALGQCINILAENPNVRKMKFVPYRDSKLTRLLKDSLGGNTKTVMIACIN